MVAAAGLVCALYLADLTGMGMVGPDEPRYAAVSRAMAQSGDWITPRLWGQPWFEKPPLLYWMTAAGFRLGLGPDLAPRLPTALLALAFFFFFWWRLRIEWGGPVAAYATAMLATSAGWLTYSHVAVTDLPLAVFFSAAVLLAMPWIARRDSHALTASAACLGLATLAKGLVPLVLFLPVLAAGWRYLRDWLRPGPLIAFSICALPWYVVCTLRNGSEFLRVFFLEQHFARFSSAALEHVQPWWFYFPVLLLFLYPWFPMLAMPLGRRVEVARDPRLRMLAFTVMFGFVFFSASVNKLPGYLLPLMPAAFILVGSAMARAERPWRAMIAPIALLGALPMIAQIAPGAVAHGIRSANVSWLALAFWLIAAGVVGAILVSAFQRSAFAITAVLAAAGFLWFQWTAFPGLDAAASARPVWLASHPRCVSDLSRSALYGLYYYAGGPIPECTVLDRSGIRVVR
jgi:4-amino-4-deoxy-L-arabinose transferase-like glycosyltransferase